MDSSKLFKDLDITSDEAERIAKAFKNEEFRKLFKEYAEEISDPENRKRYEEEIAILEGERGMDVKFINPDPGYVIKTSQNGNTKVFINICKNEHIQKPTASKQVDGNGRNGLAWQIPHSFAPPREDTDKSGQACQVYDVVFNPDTYRMAETNSRFKKLIQDTALDGIENQFAVTLDKKNLKFPKMKFKGMPKATVIRTKQSEGSKKLDPNDPLNSVPYPYDDVPSDVKAKENQKKAKAKKPEAKTNGDIDNKNIKDKYTKPCYTITHRHELDFQDFTQGGGDQNTAPRELVVTIDLPLIQSSSSVSLDIFEKQLTLESEKPAKYKLDLNLPYAVDEENSSAKFDKAKRKLVVTLPVIKISRVMTLNGFNGHPSEDENLDNSDTKSCKYESGLVQVIGSEDADTKLQQKQNGTLENDATVCDTNSTINETTSEIPDIQQKAPSPEVTSEPSESGKDIWTEDYQEVAQKAQICYVEPAYTHLQDEDVVTLVVKVANVQEETVTKSYSDGGSAVAVRFASQGMGGFPIHYSLHIKADKGCSFKPGAIRVDISDMNIVIQLTKSCAGLWDMISIAKDSASLEEKYFVTEKRLKAELEDLEQAVTMPSSDTAPELQVTDMNENSINITIKSKSSEESIGSMCELSEDIEVIHDHDPPKLHGILKQRGRTMSESSDEVFCYSRENSVSYAGSESPISESDEWDVEAGTGRTRKKSVSFSEQVDQTTYKQNQPTTSLRNTLKNKRKKHRKAERKFQDKVERRRQRSTDSISEMSSDGECNSPQDDVLNSQDQEEDSTTSESSPEVSRSTASPLKVTKDAAERFDNSETDSNGNVGNASENVEMQNQNNKNKRNKRKNRKNKKHTQGDVMANVGHEPLGTNKVSSASENESENGELITGERNDEAQKCCDSVNDNQVPRKMVEVVAGDGHDSDDNADYDKADPSMKEGLRTSDDQTTDTMLSWSDTKAAADKITCPVSFSNSVMFDLD